MIVGRSAGIILSVFILSSVSGCFLGNRPQFVNRGSRDDERTFYLDGAGNYGYGKESVPLGLSDGGYKGHVEHFIWTTYLGPLVDQMSYNHNHSEGRTLARKIEAYLDTRPSADVDIIALSAGTGVAVFTLEQLGPGYYVDHVVLLSSSLSSDYDLTKALGHVKSGIYFFWSPNDPILQGVVPIVGTVDRAESAPAGTWGATPPANASNATRKLYYERVRNVRWTPKWVANPLKLQHAQTVSRDFIRDKVAPILLAKTKAVDKAKPAPKPAPATNSPVAAKTPPPPKPKALQQASPKPPPPRRITTAPAVQKIR
jgi:hypothetical protein